MSALAGLSGELEAACTPERLDLYCSGSQSRRDSQLWGLNKKNLGVLCILKCKDKETLEIVVI